MIYKKTIDLTWFFMYNFDSINFVVHEKNLFILIGVLW